MLPNAGMSFTPFDILTAAEMNNIVENIEALSDGSGLEAGSIGNGDLASDAVKSNVVDWAAGVGNIWWEELGRDTLAAPADTLTVNPIAVKKYLRIIFFQIPSGSVSANLRFNNDSGNNYARRESSNGAADTTSTSQAAILIHGSAATRQFHYVCDVINVAASEKQVIGHRSDQQAAGAGTAPNRFEQAAKWANTSNAITRVDVVNDSTGDYAIGSSLIVLGHD